MNFQGFTVLIKLLFDFSLFESVLQCYLSNGERNQNSKATFYNCTAADLAPGVTAATEIYYDILAPGLPPNTSLPQIQVDECEGMC